MPKEWVRPDGDIKLNRGGVRVNYNGKLDRWTYNECTIEANVANAFRLIKMANIAEDILNEK